MAEHNVGCILVLAQHQDQNWNSCASHIVGLISERDYLMKIALQGKRSDATTVDEIMTPASRIKTVSPQQNVIDAMMLMTEHNIRHLPVVTSEGEVKGLISIRDVVSSVLKDAKASQPHPSTGSLFYSCYIFLLHRARAHCIPAVSGLSCQLLP